jgi:hypothetical protein
MRTLFSEVLLSALCIALVSCGSRDLENPSSYEISKKTRTILKSSKDFPGYNSDYKTRDAILGINSLWDANKTDSTREFSGLSVKKLDELIAGKFIDPDKAHPDAPTAREFLDFMVAHPQLSAHGYAVSPRNPNYGVALTGLEAMDSMAVSPMVRKNFQKFCENADSLYTANILYSHWR